MKIKNMTHYQKIMMAVGLAGIVLLGLLVVSVYHPKNQIDRVPTTQQGNSEQKVGNSSEVSVDTTKEWEFSDHPATDWKTYTNDEYGITLQYPAHYVYDENKIEPASDFTGVSITFGPPYEEVFKKTHSGGRKAASAFEVIVQKKGNSSLAEVMERVKKSPAAEVMRIENMGVTNLIKGFSAKKVSTCYPNDICNYIYYFSNNRYIYQITDSSLAGKQMDRGNFEKMISSLQVK